MLKCSECPNWGCPNRNLTTNECTVESYNTTATNTLKEAKKEDTSKEKECQLVKLAYEWWEEHGCNDIYPPSAYMDGYQQALGHPTGGELLHVLNEGHKQGYKDAIEKACKWLEKNACNYEYSGGTCDSWFSASDLVESFRKYMEEQNRHDY